MEPKFKAFIVWLILNGETVKALELLAKQSGVNAPGIKVGLPQRSTKKTLGCYNAKKRIITVLNSDVFKDPSVILHEFYHHLRTTPEAKHKGTEKYADKFAHEFIDAYRTMINPKHSSTQMS